jgi:predicted dehydrogenase
MVYAPLFSAGPETTLAGIWARRGEAATALAGKHNAPAVDRLEDLYERSDVVVFAVPPAVQVELAIQAARAGKALLLEKPVAANLAGAERLVGAIEEAGVASMVTLSWRYAAAVRAFLAAAADFKAIGGLGRFVSGALLGGPFATPWRLERGPLLDLGPHVIDLLDAALGTVTTIKAHGDLLGWVNIHLEHADGAVSQAAVCASAAVTPHRAGVELYGREGVLEIDCVKEIGADTFRTLRRELVETLRTGSHPLDARRGLHIQRLLESAEEQLRS